MSNYLSIWESRKPKDMTDLDFMSELVNEVLGVYIQRENKRKEASADLLSLDKMNVKQLEKPTFYRIPEKYISNYTTITQVVIDRVCKQYTDYINEQKERIEQEHQANLPAIENNQKLFNSIELLFGKLGVPKEYYEYEWVRNKRKEVKKYANWPNELRKALITSDNYDSCIKSCNAELESLNKWKISEENKLKQAEIVKQQKVIEQENNRLLAFYQVKYGLSTSADFRDVLEHILSLNKYLRLAHYLQKNRSDWNDGYWYAECGLRNFNAETELDNKIVDAIQSCIDNWDNDGRIFRDIEFSYDYIFGLVEDSELFEHYNKIIAHFD